MGENEKSAPEALREAVVEILATLDRDGHVDCDWDDVEVAALRAAHARPGSYGDVDDDRLAEARSAQVAHENACAALREAGVEFDTVADGIRHMAAEIGEVVQAVERWRPFTQSVGAMVNAMATELRAEAAGPADLVRRARAWVAADSDDDTPQESSHDIVRDLAACAEQPEPRQADEPKREPTQQGDDVPPRMPIGFQLTVNALDRPSLAHALEYIARLIRRDEIRDRRMFVGGNWRGDYVLDEDSSITPEQYREEFDAWAKRQEGEATSG